MGQSHTASASVYPLQTHGYEYIYFAVQGIMSAMCILFIRHSSIIFKCCVPLCCIIGAPMSHSHCDLFGCWCQWQQNAATWDIASRAAAPMGRKTSPPCFPAVCQRHQTVTISQWIWFADRTNIPTLSAHSVLSTCLLNMFDVIMHCFSAHSK